MWFACDAEQLVHEKNASRVPFQTQRSVISETNTVIGIDTLSESDTREEESAYRLV